MIASRRRRTPLFLYAAPQKTGVIRLARVPLRIAARMTSLEMISPSR
jgi:hypothetical protein